jgi:hypothetical protein
LAAAGVQRYTDKSHQHHHGCHYHKPGAHSFLLLSLACAAHEETDTLLATYV